MACALVSGELRGWEWGQERRWETRARREGQHLAGSGRRWLSRLEAGTPLNLHRAAPPEAELSGIPGSKLKGRVRSRLTKLLYPLWVHFKCLERGWSSPC